VIRSVQQSIEELWRAVDAAVMTQSVKGICRVVHPPAWRLCCVLCVVLFFLSGNWKAIWEGPCVASPSSPASQRGEEPFCLTPFSAREVRHLYFLCSFCGLGKLGDLQIVLRLLFWARPQPEECLTLVFMNKKCFVMMYWSIGPNLGGGKTRIFVTLRLP